MSTSLDMHVPVHPDTRAVLLLCASLGGHDTKPLSLREYNFLAQWLRDLGRRPADLLDPTGELLTRPDLPNSERVQSLITRGVQMATALERWERLGLWVISRGEDRYPQRLRRQLRHNAPALLFGAGDLTRLDRGGLAVVGSRDASPDAIDCTRRVAERWAGLGRQIISGGARGVDQAVMGAALEAGGGGVAVLADSLATTATSRSAKTAIRDGLLTLVTPYEPEMGFHVGRAMGRNKHIYALADHALVVCFTTGSGGTWEGAVEQLGRRAAEPAAAPVFVRVEGNPAEGWGQLREKGALPFPEESFFQDDSALDIVPRAEPAARAAAVQANLFDAPVAPVEQPLPQQVVIAPVLAPTPAVEQPASCYERCLPLLLSELHDEPGTKEVKAIAARLDLVPAQFSKWLYRAIVEGKVEKKKKGRKVVYAVAAPPPIRQGDDAA